MIFEIWQLFLIGVGYLLLLFFVAYATERGLIPASLARHPVTYVLSLGVYATTWSFYGSVGFAQSQGYNFLTIYLGVTLAFLLAPVLLQPILRLCREYQLSSLADLFAFRYQSQLAGVLVTLFMLTGTLPYIALQIRAVTKSLQVMTLESAPAPLALGFCITIILFAILFGARHISSREKHEGLVIAIAFESLVKLTALLFVGLYAIFGIFGGFSELQRWLNAHPEAISALYQPVREGPWATLLLLAFAAAFLLPRQFHMTFTENIDPATLNVAKWGFPLFLLLLNLGIPPILWAGSLSGTTTSADFYVMGITLESGSNLLPVITFIGGISSASAMIIVTTLALAAMCMNHLVLPASFPPRLSPATNIYRWLLWGRRVLITLIILAGYGFYQLLEKNQGLVQLGLISFVAVAQFLPGVVGLLYWRRATRAGFIFGLLGGGAMWAYSLLIPLLNNSGIINTGIDPSLLIDITAADPWSGPTTWSLSINVLLFVTVSLLTRHSPKESEIAGSCCLDSFAPPSGVLVLDNIQQVEEQLAEITGTEMASREVSRALNDLGLTHTELHRSDLGRLRDRIERNLTGLVGPLLARMIVDERLVLEDQTRSALADSVRYIEQHLEISRTQLRGLAAELDSLRRYHQQVLLDLPMGVCSIGSNNEIINWNGAMERLANIPSNDVLGQSIYSLPEPWEGLLEGFLRTGDLMLRNITVRDTNRTRVFNLHKAAIDLSDEIPGGSGTVILIEDLTELHTLETELAHSERLASIGRFAAGVAHEIGNPVTGIACLTQDLLAEAHQDSFEQESLDQILGQTRRISDIVQSLVNYGRTGAVNDFPTAPVNLTATIREAINLVQLSDTGRQFEFALNSAQPLTVDGNMQRLTQVFLNLLSNACDACNSGDTITIDVEATNADEFAVISISDPGHGIPDHLLSQIFEPFVTTKQPGEGTGLGLSVVYNIVEEHLGTIQVESESNVGTCFILELPIAQSVKTSQHERMQPL